MDTVSLEKIATMTKIRVTILDIVIGSIVYGSFIKHLVSGSIFLFFYLGRKYKE